MLEIVTPAMANNLLKRSNLDFEWSNDKKTIYRWGICCFALSEL